jgi:hypothetical protein
MNRTKTMPATIGKANSQNIEQLIALIDELICVVDQENCALAQGIPASRSKQIARKTELAASLEKWVKEVSERKLSVQTGDENLRLKFVERMARLKDAMDENIVRLRAAIEASRRRIEVVMRAIREQVADAQPYTSSGRISAKSASTGTNFRA